VVRGDPSPSAAFFSPSSGSSPPSLVGLPAAALVSPPFADWATALRLRFPAVFDAFSAASMASPPHGVQHVISTIGKPCTAKFRRLDPPPPGWRQPRRSFRQCWTRASFAAPAANGAAPYTW
jgi:hypothetical protein